jgi:hypothetical protein
MAKKEKRPDRFYVYIYLNPLRPGRYSYPQINQSFLYEPMYVGKGHDGRWRDHLKEPGKYKNKIKKWLALPWEEKTKRSANYKFFLGTNRKKIKAIHKILKKDIEPIIFKLIEDITDDEAYAYEQFVVQRIGQQNLKTGCLYNKCDARGGNSTLTDNPDKIAIYKRLAENFKGCSYPGMPGRKASPETRAKLSAYMKGKPSPFKGKSWSPEQRKQMSEVRKGKPLPEEARQKIIAHRRANPDSNWTVRLSVPTPHILHLNANGFSTSQTRRLLNIDGLTDAMIRKKLIKNGIKPSNCKVNFENLCFLMQRGYTDEEMAVTLGISVVHVDRRKKEIFKKQPIELYYEI